MKGEGKTGRKMQGRLARNGCTGERVRIIPHPTCKGIFFWGGGGGGGGGCQLKLAFEREGRFVFSCLSATLHSLI